MLFSSPISTSSFLCILTQQGFFLHFSSLNCCRCASLHVIEPGFFFNLSSICLFVSIVHERDVAVLVTIGVGVVPVIAFFFSPSWTFFRSFTFSLFSVFFLSVSSSFILTFVVDMRLFFYFLVVWTMRRSFSLSFESSMFFRWCPRDWSIIHRRGDHHVEQTEPEIQSNSRSHLSLVAEM